MLLIMFPFEIFLLEVFFKSVFKIIKSPFNAILVEVFLLKVFSSITLM